MKEIEKARECPICGGKSEVVHGMQDSFVRCLTESCLTLGPRRSSDEDALEAWNKRIVLETEKPTEDEKLVIADIIHSVQNAILDANGTPLWDEGIKILNRFAEACHYQNCETCDKWIEKAKQFFENGNCPICLCSDEEGHKPDCEFNLYHKQKCAECQSKIDYAMIKRMCDIILNNDSFNKELDSLAMFVGHHPLILGSGVTTYVDKKDGE